MKINHAIIRIVGLLGEENDKKGSYVQELIRNGYSEEPYPLKDGVKDEGLTKVLRDQYYPDFRNVMFLQDKEKASTRLFSLEEKKVSLAYKSRGQIEGYYELTVIKSEIFLFKGQIGLFSLSLQPAEEHYEIRHFSNIMSIVRSFDTMLLDQKLWHEWISLNYLAGKPLRGDHVMADEYSGSKFKTFSVIDADFTGQDRKALLFDLATTSPIGSGAGIGNFAPDSEYYEEIMSNRIAAFQNYEALCLFDGFCCVGSFQLGPRGDNRYATWDYTYFRIYLYRLFFKYNLYRYNSMIHHQKQDVIYYRDQFEDFLIKYNISHISFNFLGNEIFHKTGLALELDNELNIFRERINNLSAAIQEKRQATTNLLLQGVTFLGFISSLSPILDLLKVFDQWIGIEDSMLNAIITLIIIIALVSIFYYLVTEKWRKWISKIFGTK
jgi:hypothetical protein